MFKSHSIGKQVVKNMRGSFFYEDWLMNDLSEGRRKAFIPQVKMKEGAIEYCLSFRVQNLRKEQCSIEVHFPYLYIRIQQEGSGLLTLLSRTPTIHIFARHFLIPYDADAEKTSFIFKRDKLIIWLPKYYAEVK